MRKCLNRAIRPRPCLHLAGRQDGAIVLALVIAMLAGAVPVQAGTIRADRTDSQYTSLAGELLYASVGKFQWAESGSSYLASGVLINNQWVLTAAHVVADITSGNIGTMTFALGGTTYHASATYYNSGWTGDVNTGYDIGLVKLSTTVNYVTPAYLYTDADEGRDITTIVGYGKTGTGLTGATQAAGTKRAGTNVIGLGSALNNISWTGGGNDTMIVADFDSPGATGDPTVNLAVPTDLEYCAASGDSGGGWFIVGADGETYLAGVSSFLLQNPANPVAGMYGDIVGGTRVSSYLDWITSYTSYWTFVEGDTNGDGKVDGGDLAVLGGDWMDSISYGRVGGDLNLDGAVNGGDLAIMGGNWGYGVTATPLPEPGTLVFLAAGLALSLGRRNRRGATSSWAGSLP